jgi:hypothetical protein
MYSCRKCSIKEVCKLYDFAKSSMHLAEINISSCTIKPEENRSESGRVGPPTIAVAEPSFPAMNVQEFRMPEPLKEYKNFQSESNSLRHKGEDKKEKVLKVDLDEANIKIIGESPVTESIFVECPTCKGKTVDDDLNICQEEGCNKIVCSNCSTNGGGKVFCNDCWEKA